MKSCRCFLFILGFLLTMGANQVLRAQFYTGSEMTFGRKRVQYEEFIWMYYRFDGFDVYFTTQGKNLALYTANYVKNHLQEMEGRVGFNAQPGMRFIIFNRLTDFRQSNIGYLDEATQANSNTGGITRFLDNKVFLYFNGDYVDFERQIRHGLAEILVSQAITGSKIGSQYKNSYLMDLPRWFTGGVASYLSRGWDEELDERMAAAIQRKDYRYFSTLEGEEAVFAGHSFWYFLAQTYGQDAVTRCIRVVATERRLQKTFRIALNVRFKDLMNQWRDFYLERYGGIPHDTVSLASPLRRTNRKDHVYQQFVLNDQGKEAAFVSNKLGRAKVYLQTVDPQRRFCIYQTGAAINDNPDYSFPLLCFHPDGKRLGMMVEEKGRTTLIVYEIDRKKNGNFRRRPVKKKTTRYYLDLFDKVNSFSFSPDGRTIALGATLDGYPDIYLFRLGAGTRERITHDLYDDFDPVFLPGTDWLVFASNRPDDTLRKGEKFEVAPSMKVGRNLYAYNLKEKGDMLFPLTHEDIRTILAHPQALDAQHLAFTHNRYGQTNLSVGVMGKTVSHIDTAVHYRNTFHSTTVTDFQPGNISLDVSPGRNELAYAAQVPSDKGRNLLGLDSLERYIGQGTTGRSSQGKEVHPSRYKETLWERERLQRERQAYQDSVREALLTDTTGNAARELEAQRLQKDFLQIRNAGAEDFVPLTAFDLWLLKRDGLLSQPQVAQAWNRWQSLLGRSDTATRVDGFVPVSDSLARAWTQSSMLTDTSVLDFPREAPKQYMYEVEYMINAATTQLGFSYLNACYQQFTNSKTPLYLNPSASGLTQIAISDLMENHRLLGGFAFSLDFSSTEYLFSYEYLERRLGHQVILHMSNINGASTYPYKQNTYDAYYVMKYPITPVSSLRGTVFGRYDRTIAQAIDYTSLMTPTTRELRVGLKGEWVYDHSRFISQNIYFGTRGKVWLEYYQGVVNNKQNLFVFGLDFRDYRQVYKTMIWANRIAFSTSFGQQKLVYYMGGVDGWVGAKFNQDVETDPNQNYAYQTLATNLRGFTQNIRNGNTFAAINSELRIPIVQVISPRPVQSSFLRHLQLVAFGDIGSAWSGWNPWSKDNMFYKKTIEDGKLTVVLDKDANPIVGGFGFGLRMQVFGYFLRGDLAWGVENGVMNRNPVFYFSLSTDF